jgi:opacity protein-like surface antigen
MRVPSLLAVVLLAPILALAAEPTAEPGSSPGARPAETPQPVRAKRKAGAAAARARAKARSLRVVKARYAVAAAPSHVGPADLETRGPAAGPPRSSFELGAFGGWEGTSVSGLSLRLDGALALRDVGRWATLSFVGSAGYSRLGDTIGFIDLSADVYKLVPAARLTVPLGERLALFGDAGVGFAYVRARLTSRSAAFPALSASASTLNVMMRLGAGAWYRASERLKLGVLVEVDPILGDFGYTGGPSRNTVLVLAGAMFRI